jgi:hypothetical protein
MTTIFSRLVYTCCLFALSTRAVGIEPTMSKVELRLPPAGAITSVVPAGSDGIVVNFHAASLQVPRTEVWQFKLDLSEREQLVHTKKHLLDRDGNILRDELQFPHYTSCMAVIGPGQYVLRVSQGLEWQTGPWQNYFLYDANEGCLAKLGGTGNMLGPTRTLAYLQDERLLINVYETHPGTHAGAGPRVAAISWRDMATGESRILAHADGDRRAAIVRDYLDRHPLAEVRLIGNALDHWTHEVVLRPFPDGAAFPIYTADLSRGSGSIEVTSLHDGRRYVIWHAERCVLYDRIADVKVDLTEMLRIQDDVLRPVGVSATNHAVFLTDGRPQPEIPSTGIWMLTWADPTRHE